MVTFSAVLFDLDGTLHDRAETVMRYLAGHVGRFDLPYGYAERWTVLDDYGYRSKTEVFPQLVAEFRLKHDPQVLLQDFSDHAWADCQLTSCSFGKGCLERAFGPMMGYEPKRATFQTALF